MIGAAIIGIIGSNPSVQLHAFQAFDNKGNFVFPALFITVACGAVSGFHSLISSGTTSKQLDNEKNAKLIGYGAMLIECVLAVIALICIGSVSANGLTDAVTGEKLGTPATVYLKSVGKKHHMFYIPMFFMAAASLGQLGISFVQYVKALVTGTGAWNVEGLLCVFIIPIFILAVSLLVEGCKVLFFQKSAKANA